MFNSLDWMKTEWSGRNIYIKNDSIYGWVQADFSDIFFFVKYIDILNNCNVGKYIINNNIRKYMYLCG